MDNLSMEAQFAFQDGLTEIFYEKNLDLYETAFAIFEESELTGSGTSSIAQIFYETYGRLYDQFLDCLFEQQLKK